MLKKHVIIFLLIICMMSIVLSGCGKQKEMITETAFMLNTNLQISIWTSDKKEGKAIIQQCFDRISEIEQRMNAHIETSDVEKINKNAGKQYVEVSKDTAKVLDKALTYAELSDGAFDPTIGKLVQLWGVGTEHERVPKKSEIEGALRYVDYHYISKKDENKFKLNVEEIRIDLGGIAKGYAADEVYSILRNKGIQHAIVNLGGNIFTLGKKVDGSEWKVGIQNPFEPTGTHMGVVQVSDKAVVTSGNYERYFIKNDKRYHHIIDPRTGYPAENGVVSATIISNNSTDADALSTAVYVLGVDRGLRLIEQLPNVEGILITQDSKVYLSSGMKGELDIVNDQFKFAN